MTEVYSNEYWGPPTHQSDFGWRRRCRQYPITNKPMLYQHSNMKLLEHIYGGGWSIFGLNATMLHTVLDNFSKYSTQTPISLENLYQRTVNRCYSKLTSKIKLEVPLVVNYSERERTLKMISQRAKQLLAAARSLKKGDIKGFWKAVNMSPQKKFLKSRNPKFWASTWLEFHFGWSPLIHDIYSGIQVLDFSPALSQTVVARISEDYNILDYPLKGFDRGTVDSLVRMGCHCRVSDVAAFKANELGLLNPASVVWELIPFSFVVDWFLPVQQWLDSFSDFIGLEITNPYTTVKMSAKGEFSYSYLPNPTVYYSRGTYKGVANRRLKTIVSPLPVLSFAPLSNTRAMTAISLLIGFFQSNPRGK